VRVIGRLWSRLRLDWEMGLHRLPFFTQKVAVMLLGALVATRPPAPTRPAPGQVGGQATTAGQGGLPPLRGAASSVVSTLLP
jgi:hypothetical protein